MYKVIIWGTGREYNKYFNLIKMYENRGEILVKGVFSNDKSECSTLDGFPIYKKDEIKGLEYDLCLVTIADFWRIHLEAKKLGIPNDKLVPTRVLEVPYFNFDNYINLKKSDITILSNNCWAGLCYNYLGLEFLSPTINMFFERGHFNKFVANLEYYLSVPVEFVEFRYEKNLKVDYPIAKLDDLMVHFNHYTSFEDAKACWERRKKRINKENILIVFSGTSNEDENEFNKLEYEHKIMFAPREIAQQTSYVYPVDYVDKGNGVTFGMYINGFANGFFSEFDIIGLLRHKDFIRKK